MQLTNCVKKDIIAVSFGCFLWNFLDQFFFLNIFGRMPLFLQGLYEILPAFWHRTVFWKVLQVRSITNFLQKDFTHTKRTKPLTANKNKKFAQKTSKRKKSYFSAYLRFVLLLDCIFVLLGLLVLKNSFLNSPNKLAFVRSKTI